MMNMAQEPGLMQIFYQAELMIRRQIHILSNPISLREWKKDNEHNFIIIDEALF